MPLNEKFVTAKTLSLNKMIYSKYFCFSFNIRHITCDRLVFLGLEEGVPKLPKVFHFSRFDL